MLRLFGAAGATTDATATHEGLISSMILEPSGKIVGAIN
jgi:hypothetical protein